MGNIRDFAPSHLHLSEVPVASTVLHFLNLSLIPQALEFEDKLRTHFRSTHFLGSFLGGKTMAFTGTLDKCKACDKTVYVVDQMTLEGVPYHKSCFKCSHCKGFLSMSTYSSMDGILYCKPHFEQLFKESGNFSKNFTKSAEKQNEILNRAPSKLSSMFSGTQDKCATCSKTVYPLEKVTLEGESYHKSCFRCAHGGCPLTHSSYAALDGVLYCKHHFSQLFLEKGNYSHVLQAATNRKNAVAAEQAAGEAAEAQAEADATSEDKAEAEPKEQSEQPKEES